jgi:hypothetical protein
VSGRGLADIEPYEPNGPLVPAKRTVTDVRTVDFQDLLGHLRIPNGDVTEIHITVQPHPSSKLRGKVTIVTKTESDIR